MLTPPDTILNMLRQVRDLSVCRPDRWAENFGVAEGDIEQLIAEVRAEREDVRG